MILRCTPPVNSHVKDNPYDIYKHFLLNKLFRVFFNTQLDCVIILIQSLNVAKSRKKMIVVIVTTLLVK